MTTDLQPVLRFLSRSITLWVGTIFFLAGVLGAFAGAEEWRAARRFEREAVPVQGTVVDTAIERASRDGNTSTRYLVTYRFAAGDGHTLEQTEAVPVDDWEQLQAGSVLAVRYLPSDRGSARSQPGEPAWVPPLITGVTSAFALLGFLLARPGLRRALVIWRLQRRGVDAEAAVVEAGPTGTMINRVTQWQVRYEFRDRVGRIQTGSSDLLPPEDGAAWQHGDKAVIRFDPNCPGDSYWLGTRWT